MSDALRPKKEGRRRASAQLLLPWVDEMTFAYTCEARTVNTKRWVFDRHLMASGEFTPWAATTAPLPKKCRL